MSPSLRIHYSPIDKAGWLGISPPHLEGVRKEYYSSQQHQTCRNCQSVSHNGVHTPDNCNQSASGPHARIGPMHGVAARMETISGRFLGYPYITNSLVGSAESHEIFSNSLEAFDCVTYMESVLALAYAGDRPRSFSSFLRQLRYEDGKVIWTGRNHYMTQWLRNNVRNGLVDRVASHKQTSRKDRVLGVVPGLAPRRQRFSCIPKRAFGAVQRELRTGDLIFFVSTRAKLDVFHCGLLIRRGEELHLRHASRSRGAVVEEDLGIFLKNNRMAGVFVARPAERGRG